MDVCASVLVCVDVVGLICKHFYPLFLTVNELFIVVSPAIVFVFHSVNNRNEETQKKQNFVNVTKKFLYVFGNEILPCYQSILKSWLNFATKRDTVNANLTNVLFKYLHESYLDFRFL